MSNAARDAACRWQGWLRADGRKGIRNTLLVIYTVECSSHVAHAIARDEADAQVIGFSGCFDNEYVIRVLSALARHPNVGGVLCVGLGCEYIQPAAIAKVAEDNGRPAAWFYIQQVGGTTAGIELGKARLAELRERMIAGARKTPMGFGDLVLGTLCGGSDFTSGLAGNRAVGAACDRVIDQGGAAIGGEIVELIGLREHLVRRAADEAAAAEVAAAYDKCIAYCKRIRQYSISPGNFAGGLTTIEEKSAGAFAKYGSRPLRGVLKVSQTPPGPGLWMLDQVEDEHHMQFGYTNPNDSQDAIELMATGAHLIMFITGRGSVSGSPIAPTLKVTGNEQTFRALNDDMDFNAGTLLTGEVDLDGAADALLALIARVADGEPTCSNGWATGSTSCNTSIRIRRRAAAG